MLDSQCKLNDWRQRRRTFSRSYAKAKWIFSTVVSGRNTQSTTHVLTYIEMVCTVVRESTASSPWTRSIRTVFENNCTGKQPNLTTMHFEHTVGWKREREEGKEGKRGRER